MTIHRTFCMYVVSTIKSGGEEECFMLLGTAYLPLEHLECTASIDTRKGRDEAPPGIAMRPPLLNYYTTHCSVKYQIKLITHSILPILILMLISYRVCTYSKYGLTLIIFRRSDNAPR